MAVIDLLEVTGKKFIGRPLSSLYGKTGFNRFGYLLFLDEDENSKKLGEEYDFNRLMKMNNQYADYIIWLCGRNGAEDPLDRHHIFPGADNRPLSEKYGLVVYLCHERCHIFGKYAVHRNADTMRELQQFGQQKAMKEHCWTVEEFRAVFGKNYLEDNDD